MDGGPPYSKRQVSRAGVHLAARLKAVRAGQRLDVVDPEDAADVFALRVVRWWRDEHVGPMSSVRRLVVQSMSSVATPVVTARRKRIPTIIDKLTREPVRLAELADLGGVRAVVATQEEVDELAGKLAGILEIRKTKDWARNPRSSGYRAVHLHARRSGRIVEIQLRTARQDAWANLVEHESRLAGVNYKAEQGPSEVLELFRILGDLAGAFELGEAHPDVAARLATANERAKPFLQAPALATLEP
jgi:ppGpp synthetase/RelA/SpoT-type nucleotidyltranferase